MRPIVLAIICAAVLFPVDLNAVDGDPYFAFEESFALSQELMNGRYPINTFIPRTFLLFIPDRNETKKIGESQYLAATTQDGVEVFVLASTVSTNPFNRTIGRHEIIFNSPNVLCRTTGCDKNNPEQVWQIHAGDAFKMEQANSAGFYQLRGLRFGNEVIGFVRDSELELLTRRGIVTRTDFQHPKYTITRNEGTLTGTECGEIREVGYEKTVGGGISFEIPILTTFGIGVSAEVGGRQTIRITRAYGGGNKKYSFFVYDVRNNRTERMFQLVAQVIYVCEEGGLVQPLKRIKRVDLKNSTTGESYSLSFETFGTPDDLLTYTRLPYLFSVNSYEQYTELMDWLGVLFEDRALAGYFLSEFNRSCRSLSRRIPKCRSHSYREE
jgi:hypothetical protein